MPINPRDDDVEIRANDVLDSVPLPHAERIVSYIIDCVVRALRSNLPLKIPSDEWEWKLRRAQDDGADMVRAELRAYRKALLDALKAALGGRI